MGVQKRVPEIICRGAISPCKARRSAAVGRRSCRGRRVEVPGGVEIGVVDGEGVAGEFRTCCRLVGVPGDAPGGLPGVTPSSSRSAIRSETTAMSISCCSGVTNGWCSRCCPPGSGGRRTRLGLSGRGSPERPCPPPSRTSGAVPALRSPGGSRSCLMRRRVRTGFPGDVPRCGVRSTCWAGTLTTACPTWRPRCSSSTRLTSPGRRTKRTSGLHSQRSMPVSDGGWRLPSRRRMEIVPGARSFSEWRGGTYRGLLFHGIAGRALKIPSLALRRHFGAGSTRWRAGCRTCGRRLGVAGQPAWREPTPVHAIPEERVLTKRGKANTWPACLHGHWRIPASGSSETLRMHRHEEEKHLLTASDVTPASTEPFTQMIRQIAKCNWSTGAPAPERATRSRLSPHLRFRSTVRTEVGVGARVSPRRL